MFKCASCVKQGFTLSEVLLVLTVIGVVASLTIPTLIQKVSNDQYKTAWKKQFSSLSQVTTMILNSEVSGNFFSLINGSVDRPLGNLYKKYLNVVKDCPFAVNGGQCFHTTTDLTGATVNSSYFDDGAFILNDGTMIALEDTLSTNHYIWVDVNGIKPPNILGKDVFGVKVYNDGIKPFGSTGDGWENTCTTTGYGCSADFLYK